jgi:hypothetical protein
MTVLQNSNKSIQIYSKSVSDLNLVYKEQF